MEWFSGTPAPVVPSHGLQRPWGETLHVLRSQVLTRAQKEGCTGSQTGREGARRPTREAEDRAGLSQWGPGSAGLQGRLQGIGNLGLGAAASWGVLTPLCGALCVGISRCCRRQELTAERGDFTERERLSQRTSDYVTAHSQQRKGGRAPGCQGDANGSISLPLAPFQGAG